MKQFIFFVFLLSGFSATSQYRQWYLYESRPWVQEGYSEEAITSTEITINGVTPIDSDDNLTENDIFIIYQDGHHYNSRSVQREVGSKLNMFSGNGLNLNLAMEATHIYWTNLYDGDDKPPEINVLNEQTTNYDSYEVGISDPVAITANHDVVAGTDIVVIIPNKLVNEGEETSIIYNAIIDSDGSEIENYQEVELLNSPEIYSTYEGKFIPMEQSLLEENTTVEIANQNESHMKNISSFKAEKNHTYIKFSVNQNLAALDTTGNLFSYFEIRTKGKQPITYKEAIRGSHDPNYIQVLGRCSSDKGTFTTYRAHFQNTGEQPAKSIRVSFLNEWMNTTTVCVTKVFMGGNEHSATNKYNLTPKYFSLHDRQTRRSSLPFANASTYLPSASNNYFYFRDQDKVGKLLSFEKNNEARSRGFVDFCVHQIHGEIEECPKLVSAYVEMDGQPYRLETYVNKFRECKKDGSTCIEYCVIPNTMSCECNCEEKIRSNRDEFDDSFFNNVSGNKTRTKIKVESDEMKKIVDRLLEARDDLNDSQ